MIVAAHGELEHYTRFLMEWLELGDSTASPDRDWNGMIVERLSSVKKSDCNG
jgi:hypothetical protein